MRSRVQGKKVGGVMPQRSATAVMGRFSSGSVTEADGFSSELSQEEGVFHADGYSFANVRVDGSTSGGNQRKSAVSLMAKKQPIQAKLALGAVGDKYEQEADQVARQVVSQINSPTQKQSAEQGLKMGEAEAVTKDIPASSKVMRLAEGGVSGGEAVSQEVEQGIQQERGGGQPLADSIREPMEKAFGADFSGVRVHTDAQSDKLNQSIQAKAFTTGQDIFFRQGEYNPGSREGQELIAHELTHLMQQNVGAIQTKASATNSCIQRLATNDLAASNQNILYVNNISPQFIGTLQGFYQYLNNQLVIYHNANMMVDPPHGHDLDRAAGGLYRFTERMIEQFDGGWNEVSEALRLATKINNPIQYPILGIPGQEPDIEYANLQGGRTGIEAKAINSANVGQVTAQINAADAQLGGFGNLARRKILIWIAHQQNQWPGVHGFANRNTDHTLRIAVSNQLNNMNIANADVITILDINTNYGGGRKDIQASRNAPNNWNVIVL